MTLSFKVTENDDGSAEGIKTLLQIASSEIRQNETTDNGASAFNNLLRIGVATPRVFAQWTSPYGNNFNNSVSASMDTIIQQSLQRRMLYHSMLLKKGYSASQIDQLMRRPEEEIKVAILGKKGAVTASEPKTAKAKTITSASSVPATRFKPSGKRVLLDTLVNDMGKTKEQRDVLQKVFIEVFKDYESAAARVGFSNDLAGALSFFIAMHYSAYNDGVSVSEANTAAIARQLRAVLDDKDMKKVSNIDKQKIYETYIMLGGFAFVISQSAAEGKDADLPKIRKQVGGDGLKSLLKVEPSRVKVTDRGLEILPA